MLKETLEKFRNITKESFPYLTLTEVILLCDEVEKQQAEAERQMHYGVKQHEAAQEAIRQLENVLDTSKEGAWMARALDAERERDSAVAQCLKAEHDYHVKLNEAAQAAARDLQAAARENDSLKATVQDLRDSITLGNDAVRLQAQSFHQTFQQMKRDIDHLENRDRGTFSWVLREIQSLQGNPDLNIFRRKGWNGKGMWIGLQRPTDTSKMTLPYIYMYTAQGDYVPWLASQSDMLADDWEEA